MDQRDFSWVFLPMSFVCIGKKNTCKLCVTYRVFLTAVTWWGSTSYYANETH